jgi:Holliday junction resolvase-like predicted endonuclease
MAKKKIDIESTLIGVAGEYMVASELTLRGYIASITLRNSRGIDIIATTKDSQRSISVQVKTNSSGEAKWLLTKSSENFFSKTHYYVFVALKGIGIRSDFYIVPSQFVADSIRNGHSNWLKGKKTDGTSRKDSAMRNFRDKNNIFLEQWDNLLK